LPNTRVSLVNAQSKLVADIGMDDVIATADSFDGKIYLTMKYECAS